MIHDPGSGELQTIGGGAPCPVSSKGKKREGGEEKRGEGKRGAEKRKEKGGEGRIRFIHQRSRFSLVFITFFSFAAILL